MKIKKILTPFILIPVFPMATVFFTSCGFNADETKPTKLDGTVFENGNKNAFNNIFNLLNKQDDPDSFIQTTANEINEFIAKEIEINKLMQEKLRIYFFSSIYNSLNSVVDIFKDETKTVPVGGERSKGIDALKDLINDSVIKPEVDNSNWEKYDSLNKELEKIFDMKIFLYSEKTVGEIQYEWVWKTSFKLQPDSKLREILKLSDNPDKPGGDIFYQRTNTITKQERERAKQSATIDGVLDADKFAYLMNQIKYQSSKWYWNAAEQTLETIEKQSNMNPYFTNGTAGGFSGDDAKRVEFAIDFKQHKSDITLFKPVFFFQTKKEIDSAFINTEWQNYLKYKMYLDNDGIEKDEEKGRDIRIDLKNSYIKYDKKV